ncbi:MAG: sigma-70 family RNA polymerase sigma factor [Roseivirga sp.]|nr:sigma-70 family RNA polymerase sigma factor [Roseivirga sp.]
MDQDQFWLMIGPLNSNLFGFALRMLNDRPLAEDALQDVLEKLWKMRKRLDSNNNIKSFAMTVMKNKCIDLIRKKGRYIESNEPEAYMTIESNYEHIDMIEQLKKRMNLLPTNQKLIVELKDFQGFSYEEIEEITQMSVNTLRVNLSRARKKLTEPLRDEWR